LATSPDFQGKNPRIHVIVRDLKNQTIETEWDVRSCGSYKESPGKWLRLRPGQPVPT
tara:strand:+ start:176 stop:346 length:171 start_codon:yes stop_codon:yes gene_type:complete